MLLFPYRVISCAAQMRTHFYRLFTALYAVTVILGCAPARTPVPAGQIPTGRAPTVTDEEYGHQVAVGLSKKFQADFDDPRYMKVTEIVNRLAQAAHADQSPWHIYLFRDASFKNAAATRGNHVFVWTGLLDEVKSDDELAAIVAHEIAHVIAGHTDPDPNEELRKMLIGLGATAAGIAVSVASRSPQWGSNLGNITSSLTQGIGEGLFVNPYSRDLELEADQIGFFLMADAGYNPNDAIQFWSRAENNPDFSASIPFLSTHPPATERLQRLSALLPQAEQRYEVVKRGGSPSTPPPAVPSNTRSTPAPAPAVEPLPPELPSLANNTVERGTRTDSPRLLIPVEEETFEVTARRAVVYSRPSVKSRALGEFSPGSVIRGIRENKDWVEISQPDHGFVQAKTVKVVRSDTY